MVDVPHLWRRWPLTTAYLGVITACVAFLGVVHL